MEERKYDYWYGLTAGPRKVVRGVSADACESVCARLCRIISDKQIETGRFRFTEVYNIQRGVWRLPHAKCVGVPC